MEGKERFEVIIISVKKDLDKELKEINDNGWNLISINDLESLFELEAAEVF
ncbi:hypothetical protein J7J00_17595 [Bacillus sp. ISL-4]|uniref:hypothetical protein n=1 Tax=Bacillus sp. ISL-4 TaxID=2819125 RepID=UPI001BEA5704|nr:hypothetical protein [Bacillus sp. ISL-4]MBT2667297.1 hypothetical protein [Bacillus sp. ISL-4]MBT2670603.1 hypothetical protein [Streptomyces sp. ISL-14]